MKFFITIFTFVITIVNPVNGYANILLKILTDKAVPPSTQLIGYPKLDYNELSEQDKYDLQWYVIGEKSDFERNKPKKVQVWNTKYVVWKNNEGEYVSLDDACTHKGASLSDGKLCNGNIVCPYHGYEFNETGSLKKVPGISFQSSPVYDLNKYAVFEKNGWVYMNTMKLNETMSLLIDKTGQTLLNEPEVENKSSFVLLNMIYNCYSRVLSENSLDIMHIAFVHTFGNAKKPNPVKEIPPVLVGPNHYKSTYYYESGEDSIAKKIFGVQDLVIENEFILPHTTVARVIFGEYVSTVITFALPLGENKSKLFVKTYRNFWKNQLGDIFTRNSMYTTMLQDKAIVEGIDSRYMDGRFNMKFDKLQNTYTSFYKRFVHKIKNDCDEECDL